METKNLARLYVGVCKTNKINWNGGGIIYLLYLCTLQNPYIVPDLVLTGFAYLRISFDILLESTNSVCALFLIHYKV